MSEFTFVLRYRLRESQRGVDEIIESLLAAGCDDASIGTGQPGRMALEFTREGASCAEALSSALADVARGCPEASFVEASPDFVGLSDIAKMAGVSRQYARKVSTDLRSDFPSPIHEGETGIWHLASVIDWAHRTGKLALKFQDLDLARATMKVNLSRDAARLEALETAGGLTGREFEEAL